jgi:SAM-dependent methyltransferase
MTPSSPAKAWDQFLVDYPEKVFTTIQFAQIRQRIIAAVRPGRVLDMGCGPMPWLLRDLSEIPGIELYASDFSQTMLDAASANFPPGAIRFVMGDNSCLPFDAAYFDTVISVNSILPMERRDIDPMVSEVVRVLKPGARFVALLPAFETSLMARDAWGLDVKFDVQQHREFDTTGWQCFYTEDDIRDLMQRHGFAQFHVERIEFTSDQAIEAFRSIYGKKVSVSSLRKRPMFEHFLVAHMPHQSASFR